MEHLVGKRIGRDAFHGISDDYIACTKNALDCASLIRRRDLLSAYLA